MLLSYPELVKLVEQGVLTNVDPEFINAASIDITLGDAILMEEDCRDVFNHCPVLELAARQPMNTRRVDCTNGFKLLPGQFILAQSREVFNLPNDISAEYKLKSSMARIGINHCLAGWCDAGWNGSVLTLELMNVSRHHAIKLQAGDKIGQMVFFRHAPVPADRSYAARGRYNNDTTVKGMKA